MASMTLPLPALDDLRAALDAAEESLALGGVVPGARGLALAAVEGWLAGRRTAVVVPHAAEAEEVAAVLDLLAPGLNAGFITADAASFFQGRLPPLAARLELVRLLSRLAEGEIDVVVIPARVLLTPVPSPSAVAAAAIRLAVGDEFETDDLALDLATAGYRRVDLVQEAGDFAVRGWVVDVHPGGEHAIRLEMDDLRLDQIRPFDPADQRSVGEALERTEVLPLDPFPATESRRQQLAADLEGRFPALAGQLRTHAEKRVWWGLLHLGDHTARSWLDVVDAVVLCDRDEALGEMGRFQAVQRREWQTLANRDVHLPGPDEVLLDADLARARLASAALRLEQLEVAGDGSRWWRIQTHPCENFVRRIPDLVPTLRNRRAQDHVQVLAVATEGEERRFVHLLSEGGVVPVTGEPEPGQVRVVRCSVRHGFVWDGGLTVYGRRNLTAAPRPKRRRRPGAAFASDLRDLRPGDLVVHMDHGIGRFTGFRQVEVEGRALEMLVLEYQAGDSLLVPVERADLIQKYASGDGESKPKLDRLGGATWKRRKARVKKAVREMAAELLRLAAVRRASRGHAFAPDSPWQKEFEDAFEWELTDDQARAVGEIKEDMESERSMDRLLCGDVGFGKTEVAIRAAFKAVLDGRQVVVLAPTTILVEQHLETFRRRMTGFPVEIRMLSRFVSPKESKAVMAALADGTVDIVVGTHRLLGKEVSFRDLGLVIIDEEQRFGVAQKERLKALRTEVDVLSMSATPIPRTLNMAFTGLRDISLIESPPRDRQAVETTVLEFSEDIVREAVMHEMERGGQVFFVHNRVRSIAGFADWLRTVVPEAEIVVAHGQMSEKHLEKAMHRFLSGEADVLLATAIIENGLDIPNANTLLVNRSDKFGLAQLYQLRGRVGRSDRLAYAYFLVPPGQTLSPTARARLSALQEFCELGAGFRIAARDLEIRGAGNVLGAEQHGFMEAVGFETYCQLLEEAVAELEGAELPTRREVELRLGLDVQLPDEYIPEASLRLSFYKRLAACDDEAAVDDLFEELVDRYGPAPPQLDNLNVGQRIRIHARRARVHTVARRGDSWKVALDRDARVPPDLPEVLAELPGGRIAPSGEITFSAAGGAVGPTEVMQLLTRLEG
jgi:transcription-repair coupling factor (superfamily II helicase)